jgi:hypothetical protein
VGFFLCALALAAGQMAIGGWMVPGAAAGVAEDVGYTFTGLTAALGFILWKWGRSRPTVGWTIPRIWLTRVLQAVVASLPVLIGCLYFGISGAERHARTFAALPPLMYLLAMSQKRERGGSRV